MLKVIAQNFIKPQFLDQVKPLYQELIASTRQEKECISYELFIDKKNPCHFVFVEEWPNKAALDFHSKTEHFTRLVPQIRQYAEKDSEILLMDGF